MRFPAVNLREISLNLFRLQQRPARDSDAASAPTLGFRVSTPSRSTFRPTSRPEINCDETATAATPPRHRRASSRTATSRTRSSRTAKPPATFRTPTPAAQRRSRARRLCRSTSSAGSTRRTAVNTCRTRRTSTARATTMRRLTRLESLTRATCMRRRTTS